MTIERSQVMAWLDLAEMPYELCDDCHGLHMQGLQSHDAVIESRVFVESEWVLFITEVELLPSMVVKAMAYLGEFNMRLPTLKAFVDVQDDGLAKLVLAHSLFTVNSISPDQLITFINATQDAKSYALQFAEQYDLLPTELAADISFPVADESGTGGIH